MFEIYSIGDSAFLASILNAVAMICGTGDFVTLVSIGILLGAFIVCVQGVLNNGREIQWQQIFVGWIMYLCFFGPAVTVTIEDAYTGQVRVVDNVPIGVGFSGSMISNIGYGITKLFETGFSTPSRMTEQPFAEPLRLLNALRHQGADIALLNTLNESLGQKGQVDIARSLGNYIRECSMVKVAIGAESRENVYQMPYSQALDFKSNVFGTRLYLGNGQADENPTCTEAGKLITEALKKTEEDKYLEALNRIVGSRDENGVPQDASAYSNAMTMLGLTGEGTHDFIRAALIEPIYNNAAKGFYMSQGDTASAIMVNQAITQRNTQWATEQTLFMTTVRPILTFFEGFIYAITPIMAFLMVMGTFGIRLVLRYFQVVLWIQLWYPVMAICNLYITIAATGQLASISAPVSSFYALNQMSQILETWIATGGMLCAATPMISLFLVTGSTYAFTALAGRMQGQDHINEKLVTPDLQQVNPFHVQEAYATGNAFQASMINGGQNMFKQLDIGQTYSSLAASARTNAHESMSTFSRELSNQVTSGMSQSQQASFNRSLGESLASTSQSTYDSIYSKMKSEGWSAGRDATETQQEVGRIFMQATGGVGVAGSIGQQAMQKAPTQPGEPNAVVPLGTNLPANQDLQRGYRAELNGKIQGQVGAEGSTIASDSTGKSMGFKVSDGSTINFSESEMAQIRDAMAKEVNTGYLNQYAKQMAESENLTMKEAGANAIQSADSYTEAESENRSFGSRGSMRSSDLAGWIGDSSEAKVAMAQARMDNSDLRDEVDRRASKLYRATGDEELAYNAAWMETLYDNKRFESFSEVFEATQGYGTPQHNGARDNAGMSEASAIEETSLRAPERLDRGGVSAQLDTARTQTSDAYADKVVAGHQDSARDKRDEHTNESHGRFASTTLPQALTQLENIEKHRATDLLNANITDEEVDYVVRRARLSEAQTGLLKAIASQDGDRMAEARKELFNENKRLLGGEKNGWSDEKIWALTDLQRNAMFDAVSKGESKGETAMTGLAMFNAAMGSSRQTTAEETLDGIREDSHYVYARTSATIHQELTKYDSKTPGENDK